MRLAEVGLDGGLGEVAGFGDFGDGLAAFEELQTDRRGADGDARGGFGERGGDGFQRGEFLALVFREPLADRLDEGAAVVVEFLLADAGDAEQRGVVAGIVAAEMAERDIGENDVGRDVFRVGEFLAQDPQFFEKAGIAGDVAGADGLRLAAC